jgi:acyl-CoA thioesterase FadM
VSLAPRRSTVVHELHPRFRDTDAMGHIDNAACIGYCDYAAKCSTRMGAALRATLAALEGRRLAREVRA